MNIYSRKQKYKFIIFITALIIGVGFILYAGSLSKEISEQEREKIKIWAESLKETSEMPLDAEISPTLYKILLENKSIPVILLDEDMSIITHRNLNEKKIQDSIYLQNKLELMKEQHEPIVIEYLAGHKNYVYYEDSALLRNLYYYPYFQILVVTFFIAISYFAFSSAKRAEENQLWAGMSKETAHQLGTPISALVAWVELLKLKSEDKQLIEEVSKDVKRLETITERFSGIGSSPVLMRNNLYKVLINSVSYLQRRTSKKVEYILNFDKEGELLIPLNESLFEWVIENMCKNAIDAMQGKGKITISVTEKKENVFIDVHDTGKGIAKSQFKTVFKPGYTTKKRGWGLGLSLVKRIIESYHSGKVYVKSSEVNKGTTFRINLKK
ncbi:MAG: HAMP domain-containing histidine kinase [Bacteroidales bacterium]|nr:HAMP domain-containing histidine kinase [Bacteroidales bacterium]